MLTIVNILILFFIILILAQLLLANNIVEGLENQYKPYDTTNPANTLILAQQNAGNISYLKEQLGNCQALNNEVQDISGNLIKLQGQVEQLMAAQQQYATKLTGGGSVPNITGAVNENS